MISLTIDNRQVQAEQGTKILEAALNNGIDIPHMCYHPELKAFGGCRLCLVEVEGDPKLVSSCVAPVEEGMKVLTATPRILRARKSIVQLLLLNHPLDCLVCERSGSCLLQKLAFDLRVEPGKYKMKKRVSKGVQKRSVLEIDPRKCMHCGLCVRVCKEIRHYGAIDFYNRGFKTEVAIPVADEANCEFCGQCIEVCPVAGIIGLDSKYIARPWELTQTPTICPHCAVGCRINMNVKQDKVVNISAGNGNIQGVNEGKICAKGRFGYGFIQSKERLTTALIKKDGQLQPASLKEALSYAAEKLKKIKETDGGQAIGGLSSTKIPNEDSYLFQKFMRAAIGTNNIDNYTHIEHSPTLKGLPESLGLYTATNSLDRISSAELILVLGSNSSNSNPIVSLKIKGAIKSGHSKIIVADPRKISLASQANKWLKIKPGTDLALLGGIMWTIVKESLADDQVLQDNGEYFEKFKESLNDYNPNEVAKITGLAKEEIKNAARMIAKATSLAIVYSSGLTQQIHGTQNVIALADLFLLTGHVGKEQSGIYPMRDDCNSQGVCDMGVLPNYLPGYQRVDDSQMREKFNKAWGVELPAKPGLNTVQMFGAIRQRKLKALYIMGDNPIRHLSHSQEILQALKSLDFLMVQDMFMSPTAELADVVLPTASFAEREGTITNMGRRVQKLNQAILTPGRAFPDWTIIKHISIMFGYDMGYTSTAEIMSEINTLVPIYAGITYKRLENNESLYWPCHDETDPGSKCIPSDKNNGTKAHFVSLPPIPEAEKIDSSYPFKLIVGATLFHSSSTAFSMKSAILNEICPAGTVDLNPQDAAKLGINDSDTIRIKSRLASVEAKARLVSQNPEGIVFMPKEFKEELNIPELMPDEIDPVSQIPAKKVCAVNISKV
jgi:formate dehydrogenase alpha subunit